MLTEQTDPDRRRRRQTKLELSEFVAAAAQPHAPAANTGEQSVNNFFPNTRYQQHRT